MRWGRPHATTKKPEILGTQVGTRQKTEAMVRHTTEVVMMRPLDLKLDVSSRLVDNFFFILFLEQEHTKSLYLSDHPAGTGVGLSDHPLPEDAAAHLPTPGMGRNRRKLT